MKCLEKDRQRRYDTANGLAADLKRHLNNEPVVARPPSTAYRFQKAWRRNKVTFAAAALIFAVLVAATGISAWQAVLAKQRLNESEAISEFLTEILQSPDPARAGRSITVAETLGAAAKKLESNMAIRPSRRAGFQAALGKTYYALGLPLQAIPLQAKVRDYHLATSGLEHPDTLAAMSSLANSYGYAGRRDEALKMREEVLALRRKVSGPEHPDTLMAMNKLALSYFDAGRSNLQSGNSVRLDEALKLQEEALPLRRKVSGPEHPETLGVMNNLATSYFCAGRRDEALKLREKVLTLSRKVNGPEHPRTIEAMHNLAFSYVAADRQDEALKLREEVLTLSRKVNGPEHPMTLGAMGYLAMSYDIADRKEDAKGLGDELARIKARSAEPKP